MEMLEENRSSDCEPGESGGSSENRANRGAVGRKTTRKRAGIIASREIVKRVAVLSSSQFYILYPPTLLKYVLKTYIGLIYRCATCIMGVMGVFKWLRKDIVQRDRNRRSLTPKISGLNNEAYRNAIQAFIDRRRDPNESGCVMSPNSPDKERLELFIKKNYDNDKKKKTDKREKTAIPGVPHVRASDIFEIGWVAGTEDRYMEVIYAEWQNTRVSLRRHTHPDCQNAVRADLEVLTEIRHPNVLLLMATTHTDDHGLVAIFEPIDCTLYNFIHEQGERVSVQGIAKCAGNLAGALKHAHMRGYVHGAISSHCVFLATCGTVKLGGWELASSLKNPKITREYEDRLRLEIFRWQAPEIFAGQNPSKATDVYGLTLLMWEMCTMNVPWNGLNKSEVERQYIQWERGVITDLYNFPPLLNNLLDAGLQLDVSKRTLDIGRMRRFLQTLEIQYEDAEPLYIERSTNNNNCSPKGVFSSAPTSTTPSSNSPVGKRCTSAETPNRYASRKNIEKREYSSRFLDLNFVKVPKRSESGDPPSFNRNDTANIEVFEDIPRNVKKPLANEKLSCFDQKYSTASETQKKVPPQKTISMAPTDVTYSVDSADDESQYNNPRMNIKNLQRVLANRRENFFYGSDSSQCSSPDKNVNTKCQMPTQVRSKDCSPHKPASHKTSFEPSFEPKQTKSSGQYSTADTTRSANHKSQKSPYSNVPSAIRNAVVQPKVLNSNSQSFFESSLWRKEKMICISKMRKSSINDSLFFSSRSLPLTNPSTTDKIESVGSNETYTVGEALADDSKVSLDSHPIDLTRTISASTVPGNESLEALKEALDRATNIVQSTTAPLTESLTTESSPLSKSPQCIGQNLNTSSAQESVFEELYELKHDEPESAIRSIERSVDGNKSFFSANNKSEDKKSICYDTATYTVPRRSLVRDETKRDSFDLPRLSNVVCESIIESLNENDSSGTDTNPNDKMVVLSQSPVTSRNIPEDLVTFELGKGNTEEEEKQDSETSFALMIFNDKTRVCNSCNHGNSALARRRSLPAALGQLRNLSNVSLGKLPIRKADIPDNTVEDIYIDDEFGDNLNVNMVLLDGDTMPDDEEFLPDLLELSDPRVYP